MRRTVCVKSGRSQSGFTCIELLAMVLPLVAGAILAFYLHGRWGILGASVGFVGGVGIWLGAWALLDLFIDWLYPPPACRCGCKGAGEFQHIKWLTHRSGDIDGSVSQCRKCGRRYLQRRKRFLELLPNESLKPYLVCHFGRWRPDYGDIEPLIEPWPPEPKA